MQDDAQPNSGETADLAAEREELLRQRRNRQTGSMKGTKRAGLMSLALVGGSLFLFIAISGPSGVLRALRLGGDGQGTSSVDMKVDKEKHERTQLDFVVPAAPEPPKEKPVDPNAAWNERFKEVQDKLAEMERNKQSGVSANDIRQMLSSYNDTVTKKLEEERKAMAEENARLRLEAQRAEELRQRAEEQAKLSALNAKERQKIDKMQRESNSVIVDEQAGIGVGQNLPQGAEDSADLDQNERFLKSSASSVVQTSVSQKLYDKSRMLVQGTIISAVLETAIDTQLPGNIRAQVMQPVYSFDGSRVLMPPGTLLIGQFNNDVDIAQKRVLIAWNRAITPDGKSIAIGSTGTDTLGRAGTLGNVDNRYGTKFGAAFLISAISAIPTALSQRSGGGKHSGSSGGTTINVGDQMAGDAGGDLSDQASGVLEKYLSLPPIIRIPQGEEIRVFVNRDLLFR